VDSLQLLKKAGVLAPAGDRVKPDLTPEEFLFIEKSFSEAPDDAVLGKAYLSAIQRRGIMLHTQGEYSEAVLMFDKGLAINPALPEMQYTLGCSLQAAKQDELALAAWRKAALLREDFLEPRIAVGNVLLEQKQFAEAIHYFKQALGLRPDDDKVLHCLAIASHFQGDYEEALDYYNRALQIAPDSAVRRANRGKLLLTLGNLEQGFRESEWRVEGQEVYKRYCQGESPKVAWQGENFSGKRLLVECEQGLGDVMQFSRYLPMVKSRGGVVIFSAWRGLLKLFSRLAGVDILVEYNPVKSHTVEFDLIVPLMSLPHIFGTTVKTIPSATPYLSADPEMVRAWQSRLPAENKQKKIGLVWATRMTNDNSRSRCCGLKALAPILAIPGIAFYSLQIGEGAKELLDSQLPIVDLTAGLKDFDDTAALVANLDLVITVDTSVAHLAGAMGKPTWVLLQFLADWRWLLDREDSPWYPDVRLFRQPNIGDWAGAIAKVAEELGGYFAD